jgi:type III restriction enzyme
MILLKPFQEKAVSELLKQTRKLISSSSDEKKCVFKSPTGSGKTIMMAEWLKRIGGEAWSQDVVFIWASLYNLHTQSKQKLAHHLQDSSYRLIELEDMDRNSIDGRTILFVNWHSLTTRKTEAKSGLREWSNVFVKDREDGKSIPKVMEQVRTEGKKIILIVDEAHRNYLTEGTQTFISEIFQPNLIIEVSATPQMNVTAEDLVRGRAGLVSVEFGEVVESGLIKQETVINLGLDEAGEIHKSADEFVIDSALKMREELGEAYRSIGSGVNPLILIQLPNEKLKTSALDDSVRDLVEKKLLGKGMSYENGKAALWLADDKKNKEGIERNDSEVEVLIFKEAVAVGWDCPRAQILVMLREIHSVTFEIQTIGRILRMPEAHHYGIQGLDRAYVFTNIEQINIASRPEELDFFKITACNLEEVVEIPPIASTYVHREDYGDLTSTFTRQLVEALNEKFDITSSDTVNSGFAKADKLLELYDEELTTPIISNLFLKNLDSIEDEIGSISLNHVFVDASKPSVQQEFDWLMKAWSLPFAPVRSFSKIKSGIYRWFEQIGFDNTRWDTIQKVIVCSEINQKIFADAIEEAKAQFRKVKSESSVSSRATETGEYSPPRELVLGENYLAKDFKKYGYKPALVKETRPESEKAFERYLEEATSVRWWFKNGEGKKEFFSIAYEFVDPETQVRKLANFFPDFFVGLANGQIGIFETKAGITVTDPSTAAKSDALQTYLSQQKLAGFTLVGGIVNVRKEEFFLFEGAKYTADLTHWTKLSL